LPRSEYASLIGDEEEDEYWIEPDKQHKKPSVIGCIAAKHYHKVFRLPTKCSEREDQMSQNFKNALSRAFREDYGMPNIVHFGSGAIRWRKKLAFDDPDTEHRIVFRLGEFIQHHGSNVARIDHIFVHELDGKRRVFVALSRVDTSGNLRDEVLGFRLWTLQRKDVGAGLDIIGLPSILAERVYLIPVTKSGDRLQREADADVAASRLLVVENNIEYL
jgi:hypothetical protein